MEKLQPRAFEGTAFNVTDPDKFRSAIKLLKESLFDGGATLFCADNLISWNRNLSFLRDEFYLDLIQNHGNSVVEKSIVWRTYILIYFAELASRQPGDFLEVGCHTGYTALQVLRKIDLRALGKAYYLYDLFGWKEGDEHTRHAGHNNPRMHEDVVARFSPYDFVRVIKGSVPASFHDAFPERIAFAHVDMNHPAPEAAAFTAIFPRLSAGGVIVFDDYGWWGYSAQKIALDKIAEEFQQKILELPTGQGVLIKG